MRNIFILMSCFLCAACTERMDIVTDNAVPRLVITGCITTDTMPHIISISQTVGYFGNEEVKTFSNAVVKINGDLLIPLGDGRYATNASFYGVPGQTYALDVELDYDDNGVAEHYTAQTTVPPMHTLDSASLHIALTSAADDPVWSIFVHFQDQPGLNTYGAHLYVRSPQYSIQFTNKLQYYFLNMFGKTTAEGQYIHFPVFFVQKELRWDEDNKLPLCTGDTLTVELNELTEVYYDFLRSAKREINGGNPLFTGPPANVPGNISGGALGVFGAYTVSRQFIVLEEKYGFPQRPPEAP
jgi:hypothetical protein